MQKYFLIVLFMNIALAQESNVVFSRDSLKTDSLKTKTFYPHQIGIGISRFVNSAFPTDSNSFLLEYIIGKTKCTKSQNEKYIF